MAIVKTDDKHYKNIANAIRNNIPIDEKLKPEQMPFMIDSIYAEGIQNGYNDGYQIGTHDGYVEGERNGRNEGYTEGYSVGKIDGVKSEYDRFWDSYQSNGNRTNYNGAFYGAGWNNESFKPKYDIKPTGVNVSSMFRETTIKGSLKTLLENLGVVLDTSGVISFSYSFYNNREIEVLPLIDMSNIQEKAINAAYAFANCVKLKSLEIKVSQYLSYTNCFSGCSALEDLYITGTIGKNGFSVSASPNLTQDSLMNIINALANYSGSGTTYTVTLGATNLAKLTNEQKAIATQKGWTLA